MGRRVTLTLDDLPVFATDRQLAEAIVGPDLAEKWVRDRLPTLANQPGFPKIDDFHGGRPVALVRRFYEAYLGVPAAANSIGKPDGREDESAWTKSRRRA